MYYLKIIVTFIGVVALLMNFFTGVVGIISAFIHLPLAAAILTVMTVSTIFVMVLFVGLVLWIITMRILDEDDDSSTDDQD